MLLSTALLLEYEAVCQRGEHRLAAGLTTVDVAQFLDGLAVLAEPSWCISYGGRSCGTPLTRWCWKLP